MVPLCWSNEKSSNLIQDCKIVLKNDNLLLDWAKVKFNPENKKRRLL